MTLLLLYLVTENNILLFLNFKHFVNYNYEANAKLSLTEDNIQIVTI
jgi:hypothetical protein